MNKKRIILFLLGFIPLLLGFLLNYLIMKYDTIVLPHTLIGVVFLVFWIFIGYLTSGFEESTKKSSMIIHLVAFVMLLIFVLQILIFKEFKPNMFGVIPQFYYLPLFNIAGRIQRVLMFITGKSFIVLDAIIAFLLMIGSYRLGNRFK